MTRRFNNWKKIVFPKVIIGQKEKKENEQGERGWSAEKPN